MYFNLVGSKGLFPLLSSHTTVRTIRYTAIAGTPLLLILLTVKRLRGLAPYSRLQV